MSNVFYKQLWLIFYLKLIPVTFYIQFMLDGDNWLVHISMFFTVVDFRDRYFYEFYS